MTTEGAVVELRQYTLKPGQRDVLIDIFERHFIEAQERAGAQVIGHFRDLDDPDRFVWLRGFPDMPSRKAALEAIYSSHVWHQHRDAVNETLVDYENVLLLRPAKPGPRFTNGTRPSIGSERTRESVVTGTIWPFAEPISPDTIRLFADEAAPALTEAGASLVATLVTEPSANNYPRLAIRESESVFVWFSRFDGPAAHDAHRAVLAQSPRWRTLMNAIGALLDGSPQTLRLQPCARSRLA